MEKPNFTPGPWKWEPDNWNGGYSGIVGPDGERILAPNCKNDGDDGAAWFEDFLTKPDANLIVAAPDLYEALLHAKANMPHPDQMIDAALAKARGE